MKKGIVIALLLVVAVTGCKSNVTVEEDSVSTESSEEASVERESEEEAPVERESEEKAPEESYLEYLTSLQIHDTEAIPKALSEYQSQIKGNLTQEQKDEIFRYFESFFYLVQESVHNYIIQ